MSQIDEIMDDDAIDCPEDQRPLYPWFGSKRRIADEIWRGLGQIDNYIEPFLGSCSVLLARPDPSGIETVNDLDHFIANFWRAIRENPEAVAAAADRPVIEADLEAWHYWLVSDGAKRLKALMPDPRGYDAEIAGVWAWGQCCWIGSGWCSGKGPWMAGELGWEPRNAGQGVNRQRPHLRNAGQGVNRQRPHLGDAGQGVNRKRPHLGDAGQGVNRQLPHLGNAGKGACGLHRQHLIERFRSLANRLRYVRICCGDWSRVLTPSVTTTNGVTGVVLDPPYTDEANRTGGIYAQDCGKVGRDVYAWAMEHGDDPRFKIVLCGYEGEYAIPATWRTMEWSATGGYSGFAKTERGKINKHKERVWFSPHCIDKAQTESLFAEVKP